MTVQQAETTEHKMFVVDPLKGTEPFTWNGQPEEREQVAQEFVARMATGGYLAYAASTVGGVKEKKQIREFDPEAEEIYLTPRLVGG